MHLEHANLTVRSVAETVRFLQLAFPSATIRGGGPIHGDAALGRWVHFGTSDSYIALQQNASHSASTGNTYVNDGINHIGFVVEKLDALVDTMKAAGFPMSDSSAMDSHPSRKRAYFYDPNGIEWEFVEYLVNDARSKNDYTS